MTERKKKLVSSQIKTSVSKIVSRQHEDAQQVQVRSGAGADVRVAGSRTRQYKRPERPPLPLKKNIVYPYDR